ncbi:MAG: OmpA family protein [Burkholderiales bacterium]|nr:OmpA family protein [Burkholderiales bacterium]
MKVSKNLGMLLATLGLAVSAGASAQNSKDAYVQDARGVIVRNSNFGDPKIGNLCWRTGYWTPATANCECDAPIVGAACAPPKPAPPKVAPPPPPPKAQPQPPKPQVQKPKPPAQASLKVTFAADAFFDFNKAVLKPEAKAKLDDLVGKLKGIALEVVIAVGHTDSVGGDAYNQKLSVKRAEAVKAYLVTKGIEPNRIYTEGKGKKQPVADNKTAEGRAKNRRVEIEVVGTRPNN